MRERGDRTRLALEARGVRVRREQLDRDVPAELEILRAPDLGHAAAPEQVVEPVAAGDDGLGHGDTLCADRERLTHTASRRRRSCSRARSALAGGARPGRGGRRTGHARSRCSALVDLPPFASSAMDGFAVRAADLPGTLPVVERIAAGRPAQRALEAGEAMEISTGGVVPAGADCRHPHRVCCPT